MSQFERNPAIRTVAASLNQATYTFKQEDKDRAPEYAVLPTGVAVNRVLHIGTVTEVEDVGSNSTYMKARIVDQTGAVHVYAGQYQPDAMADLQELETPAFVAVVGKVNTYETDDGETYVSLRPEEVNTVSKATQDRWAAEAISRTLQRIETLRNGDEPNSEIVEYYGTDADELREEIDEAVNDILDRAEMASADQETAPTPA